MMHDDLLDELDRFFGDYVGDVVHIEQTVIDADIERARDEERRWQRHLQRHGERAHDKRVAECKIIEAQAMAGFLGGRPPNRRLVQRLSCDLDAGTCTHSAQDWYLHADVATRCDECDEVPGPIARYTLVVWREHEATEAA
jgi:hypothetical protein